MSYDIIVDIETISGGEPNETLKPFLASVRGGRSQNALGQQREKQENIEKAKKKHLLSPVSAKVLSIGISETTNGDDTTETKEFIFSDTGNESLVIEQFANKLNRPNIRLITFNGRNFDFPFLMFRAAVYGIPLSLPISPYNGRDNHIDLFTHLNHISNLQQLYNGWQMIGLKKWYDYFEITVPKPSIGSGEINLEQLFKDGNFKAIEEYQMADIEGTRQLWKRFEGNFQNKIPNYSY